IELRQMQGTPSVDHREDGCERYSRPLLATDMILDHVQRALRQHRGNDGYPHKVRSTQDLVRSVGKAGRTIDDDPIVRLVEFGSDLGEALSLAQFMESIVERA